jgi:hypothetical protein
MQFCTHWVNPASDTAALSTQLAGYSPKSATDGLRAGAGHDSDFSRQVEQ